jgi:hypothetical protein
LHFLQCALGALFADFPQLFQLLVALVLRAGRHAEAEQAAEEEGVAEEEVGGFHGCNLRIYDFRFQERDALRA